MRRIQILERHRNVTRHKEFFKNENFSICFCDVEKAFRGDDTKNIVAIIPEKSMYKILVSLEIFSDN